MMDKLTAPMLAFVIGFILMVLAWPHIAWGHDDGRYANSPHKDWIKSLKDKFGVSCCDTADGEEVEGWAFGPTGYRIKVKGEWLDVPPSALLTVPNILGFARAWIFYENGRPKVRCFLPGAGG